MDAVKGSLERLGTDHIDLYQIHGHRPGHADRGDRARARRSRAPGHGALYRRLQLAGLEDHEGASASPTGTAGRASARCRPTTPSPAATWSARSCRCWRTEKHRPDGVEPAGRRPALRQVRPRRQRAGRRAPRQLRLPAGRQGPRLRLHRRDARDRRGARRVGGAGGAGLGAGQAVRHDGHHRRQDHRAARRQSRRRQDRSSAGRDELASWTRSARCRREYPGWMLERQSANRLPAAQS